MIVVEDLQGRFSIWNSVFFFVHVSYEYSVLPGNVFNLNAPSSFSGQDIQAFKF